MAPSRDRFCACATCSQWPGGRKSVSYATWHRHQRNAPEPGTRALATAAARQQQSGSSGSLQHPRTRSSSPDEPVNHDPPDGPDGPANFDLFDGPDNSSDIDSPFEPNSPVRYPAPQVDEPEQADNNFRNLADPVEERYRIESPGLGGATPRVHVNNLLRHHDLDPSTRHIFTVAAHAKAMGVTNEVADLMLDQMSGHHRLLTGDDLPDATSNIRTAESRLGVHPDDYITRYIVCPGHECWNLTLLSELYSLDSPTCNRVLPDGSACQEDIFTSINTQRFPIKVLPYTKISLGLSMLLQDKEVVSHLQDWRQDDERDTLEPDNAEPYPRDQPFWTDETLLHGLSDGSAWRSSRCDRVRTVREDGTVGSQHVDGLDVQRHSSLPFGLKLIVNLDRFAIKEMTRFSVGAIYVSLANLPRHLIFRKQYTLLVAVIPGPKEPPTTALNRVLDPIVDDLRLCEEGFMTHVRGLAEEQFVQCRVLLNASDIPATKKLIGSVGLSHNKHPCHYCGISKDDINSAEGYNWRDLPPKDAGRMLDACFESYHANPGRQAAIEREFGIRHSSIMNATEFEHARSNPVDPMHNSFLGLVKSFINFLFRFNLFEGRVDGTARAVLFTDFFESAEYPGHLGRIPERVAKQFSSTRKNAGSGLKADQWKRVIQMLPGALFAAFRREGTTEIDSRPLDPYQGQEAVDPGSLETFEEDSGEDTEEGDAAPARGRGRGGRRSRSRSLSQAGSRAGSRGRRNARPALVVSRDRNEWYLAGIQLAAGLRILHAHSLSVRDARNAVEDLSQASRRLLNLGVRLTINWHIAMHYHTFVELYGPLSGYGTWAFERNNGLLANVNHNGKERDLATTLVRSWMRELRIAAVINNPAPDATEWEKELIRRLIEVKKRVMGSLMLEEARGNAATHYIRLPEPFQKGYPVDLVHQGGYRALLEYVTICHPEYRFVDRAFMFSEDPILPDRGHCYRLYTHAIFNGFKFCSALYGRTKRGQYALAKVNNNGRRELVRLRSLLQCELSVDHIEAPLKLDLALVDYYRPHDGSKYPWHQRSLDLGLRCYDPVPQATGYIHIENLQASTIVAQIEMDETVLVSMSCDKDGHEPEYWLENDLGPAEPVPEVDGI